MQTFFVLGLIPGTNIQINFNAVLVMFILFILIILGLNYRNRIRELFIGKTKSIRIVLHANQLHTRFK